MEPSKEGLAEGKRPLRGSWTPTQKRQIVEESYAAGADVAEVAQRHGVRPALLSSWRRQLSRMATSSKKTPKFAAVARGCGASRRHDRDRSGRWMCEDPRHR
jgi:transposase-like protein